MKPNVVWYDIPALNIDWAIRFYSGVLGAPVEKEEVGDVVLGWLPPRMENEWAAFARPGISSLQLMA